MLTTVLMKCEKCRNLSVPATRVLFFRVFPQFKRIAGVSKFIRFERNAAQVFDTHQRAKLCEAFTKFPIFFWYKCPGA